LHDGRARCSVVPDRPGSAYWRHQNEVGVCYSFRPGGWMAAFEPPERNCPTVELSLGDSLDSQLDRGWTLNRTSFKLSAESSAESLPVIYPRPPTQKHRLGTP